MIKWANRVYCGTCKHRKHWEAYGGYCGYKCLKASHKERSAISEWVVYEDAEVRNAGNDCDDYEPGFWAHLFNRRCGEPTPPVILPDEEVEEKHYLEEGS